MIEARQIREESTMSNSEDLWRFLPEDDTEDTGGRSAEQLAMHVQRLRRRRRARDPGLSDVDIGPNRDEGITGIEHFADEEADVGEIRPIRYADDLEMDVQELLERQGYAFAAEPEEVEPPTGPGASSPWMHHLEAKRQRLRDLRTELTIELPTGESQRELDSELSSLDQHPADAASMTYELEVEQALLHQIDDELGEIEAAFERLESGGFGRCEMCGGQIGDERLRARPEARLCVAHERLARGVGP